MESLKGLAFNYTTLIGEGGNSRVFLNGTTCHSITNNYNLGVKRYFYEFCEKNPNKHIPRVKFVCYTNKDIDSFSDVMDNEHDHTVHEVEYIEEEQLYSEDSELSFLVGSITGSTSLHMLKVYRNMCAETASFMSCLIEAYQFCLEKLPEGSKIVMDIHCRSHGVYINIRRREDGTLVAIDPFGAYNYEA